MAEQSRLLGYMVPEDMSGQARLLGYMVPEDMF
jgi:hypothetical protein